MFCLTVKTNTEPNKVDNFYRVLGITCYLLEKWIRTVSADNRMHIARSDDHNYISVYIFSGMILNFTFNRCCKVLNN